MKYNCVFCNFHTARKTEYSRHLLTKKHIENVPEMTAPPPEHSQITAKIKNDEDNNSNMCSSIQPQIYNCIKCHAKFTRLSSLTRHKNICLIDDIDTLKKENEKIKQDSEKKLLEQEKLSKDKEIEYLKEQVKIYENQAKTCENQAKTYLHMLTSLTPVQSINYFSYISSTYPNTPSLKKEVKFTNMLEAKTMNIIEVITMYHENKTLVKFIGDYIVKIYKKEKPSEQSMWSTDVSRLTYIISESCKTNPKDNIWSYDKKGIKIKEIVIEPSLQYIKDELLDFAKANGHAKSGKKFNQLKAALEIIPLINGGQLSHEIAKYIVPQFKINMNDNDNSNIIKPINI